MVSLNYMFWKNFRLVRFFSNVTSGRMKVLNVAEKNDAAKTLAGFMSKNIKRREGISKFNKIYEFECTVLGQKCEMIMTSVSGHLLGLEFVGAYKSWKSCNPLVLFDAPVVKHCLPGYEDIKRTLEREVRKCSMLIIWTDCDREGENIGFEIIEVCRAVKQNIRVYRAKFSEITYQSVQRALHNLTQPDKRINDAVEVRQELDLRIGAAFTRFQTLRLQQVFPEHLGNCLLSYGSCQFPTLGFVVERYKAIDNFIPESFWKIKVTHESGDLKDEFSWKRGRLFDEVACLSFYDLCMENPVATVQSVNSKPKSKWRPLPLDTIELEKVGSSKLKINAKEIMRIAEKLYTQGFISYPRTETNIFPKELDLANLIAMQTGDQNWGEFANRILQNGPNPRNGNKSDKAHPPIHPIKYTGSLEGTDRKVYEFVVRRFLACCSKDAEGQETIVEISINGELFVAHGLMIIAKNYLEVYPYDKWNAKEILVYRVGQEFSPKIEIVDGTTSPPKYLTEADLIALMEKHGIGTDATHADHIETIKSRKYVGLENEKFFVPGHLGMGLVDGYDSMGFPMSKPHLRSELEADLVSISQGTKSPEIVLKEQIQKYKQVFEVAIQQASKIDEALATYLQEQPQQPTINIDSNSAVPPTIMPCPVCSLDMTLREKRDTSQKFVSCMGFPNCKNGVWFPSFVESVEATDETCDMCGPNFRKLKFTFRRGALPAYFSAGESLCIGGCDKDLLEILNISIAKVQRTSPAVPSSVSSSRTLMSSQSSYPSSRSVTNVPSSNPRDPPRGGGGAGRGAGRGTASHGGKSQPTTGQKSVLHRPGGSGGVISGFDANSSNNANRYDRMNLPAPNDGNNVVCTCNQPASLLTVQKGNNIGRLYYKCTNRVCEFFQWADSAAAVPQTNFVGNSRQNDDSGFHGSGNINGTRSSNSYSNRTTNTNMSNQWPSSSNNGFMGMPSNSGTTGNEKDAIVCECNVNAVLFTVRKDGPNKGRPFYSCGKRGACKFFLWADTIETDQRDQRTLPSRFNTNTGQQPQSTSSWDHSGSTSADGNSGARCRCGGPARRLITKDGPNKGRPFYTCPKSIQKCTFFAWADEESSTSFDASSSSWRWNNQGNGRRNQSSASDSRRKRKCGNCQEEGHTKRTCPRNNN